MPKQPTLKNVRKAKTPTKSKQLNTYIPPTLGDIKKRSQEKVVFSFEFFDRTHEAFNLGKTCVQWYIELLDVVKDISGLTWQQVNIERRKKYDPHSHDWNKTNYKYTLDEQMLQQHEGVQFRLSKSKGRVHGFMVGNIFYVYWLDPYHNMNDSPGYGGVQKYKPYETCFEQLNRTIKELSKENTELKQLNKLWEDEVAVSDNKASGQ